MKHNTNTLGYKLLSGNLKKSRRHSEQLNKYLAGFLDADGCVGLVFGKYKNYYTTSLTFNFQQSLSNDPDGSLTKALYEFYNLGSLNYRDLSGDFSSVVVWTMGSSDIIKLFNLIKKHLRIKGTHWENLIWLYNEVRNIHLTDNHIEELKSFSICSRTNSKWLKQPKHLSYAWFAGFLDGDGHYRLRFRKKYVKSYGKECNSSELSIHISCDMKDFHIINQIQKDFGGSYHLHKQGHLVWRRALGKNSSGFAKKFLNKILLYVCLEKKYLLVEQMIQFHNNYQQRLNKDYSKENMIVQ